jgi:hypothetical protein
MPGSTQTRAGILGEKKAEAYTAGFGYFSHMINDLRSKEAGLAFRTHRLNEAEVDGTLKQIYEEYPGYMVQAAFNKALGPQGAAFERQYIRGLPGADAGDTAKMEAIIRRTAADDTVLTQGPDQSWSFSKAMRVSERAGVSENGRREVLTRLAAAMEDKNVPDSEKRILARKAWSPINAGMTVMFSTPEERKESFNLFTNDKKIEEAFRLGQGDAKVWSNFKDWAGGEIINQYKKNIIDVNNAIANHGRGYHIGYNNDPNNPRLEIAEEPNLNIRSKDLRAAEHYRYLQAKTQVDNFNDALRVINKISELEGSNKNASIYKFMNTPGFTGPAAEMILKMITGSAYPLKPDNKPPEPKE